MNLNNKNSIIKVAHRGVSSLIPENTIASYKYALTLNIDMLEIDIHRTKDNKLVVMHDATTERTTLQKGVIKELTYEELLKYDVGIWKGEEFKGERIPLFKDVLSLVKSTNVVLLIEVKKPERYLGIEKEVLEEIKESGIDENKIIIQSFNRESVKRFRALNETIELGVLLKKKHQFIRKDTIRQISKYAQYLNPNYKIASKSFIDNVHYYNMKTLPYTVNDEASMKKLIELNVDGIISDYPQNLIKLLEE